MAQVYQFVDENGVTRLFAEIQPDPAGTPFNGGTITAGLTIDPPTTTQALAIVGGAGSGADAATEISVTDDNAHTLFTVDAAGEIVVNLVTANGGIHSFTADSNVNLLKINAYGGPAIVFYQNAATIASALSASSFAFWLDDTPAATKLMVKAKDSNGTVVAAAIALT